MPVVVLVIVALVAGAVAGLVARRWPVPVPGAATAAPVAGAVLRRPRLRAWIRARRDPEVVTGLALTVAAATVMAGAVVVGVLALLIRGNDALRRADAGAADWGHDHASAWSHRVVDAVTRLGDTPFVIAAGLAVCAVAAWRGRTRVAVPFLLVTVVGVKLVTTGVKDLVDRARPAIDPVAATLGPSFPSGHSSTAAAFLAAAALVLGLGAPRRVRITLTALAVGLAAAVACSRVLLDVHWLSDVVAGLALGWAWFALCAVAFGGRLMRFGAPAERAGAVPEV